MNLYKNHTPREIVAVLEHSDKLTYEAKLNLLDTIRKQSIDISTEKLEEQIAQKEAAIANLENLDELGFHYEENTTTGEIVVKRTSKAKIMDIISIVLGVLLSLVGLIAFWLLVAIFTGDNEFGLDKLFTYVLMITAGLVGFKMLSGIERFLDFNSFLLTKSGDEVTIKKGGLPGAQTYLSSQLGIEEEEGELVFHINDIEFIRANQDNLVQRRTLETLLLKMTANR
ncbi:hypothetical protein [uncultured Dokdonia sp.]|uniref:hypothetical protein n=1 Tax=uncultured Dokdonia sp. TaxID=575653 RepID=UPI0026073C9C|nr:hypothetical protein [uncultured Dokdonia sp.]